MVSELSTSRVMVLPVRVLTKLFFQSVTSSSLVVGISEKFFADVHLHYSHCQQPQSIRMAFRFISDLLLAVLGSCQVSMSPASKSQDSRAMIIEAH